MTLPHILLTSINSKDNSTKLCHTNYLKLADEQLFFFPHLLICFYISLLIDPNTCCSFNHILKHSD